MPAIYKGWLLSTLLDDCDLQSTIKGHESVVTWENAGSSGGSSAVAEKLSSDGGDSSEVTHKVSPDVMHISSTVGVFAAIKSDESVVTWGSVFHGGDSSEVTRKVSPDVMHISSTVDNSSSSSIIFP